MQRETEAGTVQWQCSAASEYEGRKSSEASEELGCVIDGQVR